MRTWLRRTNRPSRRLGSRIECADPEFLSKLDSRAGRPYLSWVTEESRRSVPDPPVLIAPRPLSLVFANHGLSVGGVERLTESAVRVLSGRHKVHIVLESGESSFARDIGRATCSVGGPDALLREATARHADAVFLNNGALLPATGRLAALGIPSIIILHGLTRWNVKLLSENLADFRAARSIWTFRSVAAGLRELTQSPPCYAMYTAIDPIRWSFHERHWARPFEIGYVGRVGAEKNLLGLMALWRRIRDLLGNDVRFHFVGGADLNSPTRWTQHTAALHDELRRSPDYVALARGNQLVDHGLVRDVEPVMALLHALTLTSDFEGQPVSLVEAMASGALVSCRAVGEVAPLIEKVGLLTFPSAPRMDSDERERMATNLVRTLVDPDGCCERTRLARQRIEGRHTIAAWCRDAEALALAVICS